MKRTFIKGLLLSCGLLLPLIILGGIAYAAQIVLVNNKDIGNYEITPRGYEFTWVESDPNCIDLSQTLGYPITAMESGGIEVGYTDRVIEGNHIQVPIIKQGKRIVFSVLPSAMVTDKLDYELGLKGFQRTGGKSVVGALLKIDTIKIVP